MHIFLDTANIEQIKQAARLGVISGVTTNPSLLAKERTADYETVTKKICSIIDGPVSVEVLSEDAEGMIKEARMKATWAHECEYQDTGYAPTASRATSVLSKENIKVNMTLCFSANQALLAALAGAAYVSSFVGRLDDIGQDGMQVVDDIAGYSGQLPDFETEVIAASIRTSACTAHSAAKAGGAYRHRTLHRADADDTAPPDRCRHQTFPGRLEKCE